MVRFINSGRATAFLQRHGNAINQSINQSIFVYYVMTNNSKQRGNTVSKKKQV